MNNPLCAASQTAFETKFGSRERDGRAFDKMLMEAVLTPHEPHAKQLVEQVDDERSEVARHVMQIFMHDDFAPEQAFLANDCSLIRFADVLGAEELD
jgi:hypothetical protein